MTNQNPAPSPEDIVIVGAARTAQGKMLGALASKSVVDLGATVIGAALERAGVSPESVDHVIMGQVVQAGAGQNPAKQSAVAAGVPVSTPAATVNKVCLSGLDAVISASRLLHVGDAEVVVAGGQESMSNAPHVAAGVRAGAKFGSLALQDSLERDGLTDPVHGTAMGVETEGGQHRPRHHPCRAGSCRRAVQPACRGRDCRGHLRRRDRSGRGEESEGHCHRRHRRGCPCRDD